MDLLVIWILVGLGLFCLSVIILMIIIFVRLGMRKNVHGVIFMKSGGLKRFRLNKLKETAKTIDGEKYNLENDAIVKTSFKDFIYYMEGNPNPLKYDFKANKPEMVAMELRTILKNDLIQKLFADDDINLIKLLVIINLILTALVLIICAISTFGHHTVTLANNAENYNFLLNVTKNAIKGF